MQKDTITYGVVKRYIHCPLCGRFLMKCQGVYEIEICCRKCSKNLVVECNENKIIIMEQADAKRMK